MPKADPPRAENCQRSQRFGSKFWGLATPPKAAKCVRTKFSISRIAFHTIAKIEVGATPDPRIETVKKIADALGVSIDDLRK